MVSTQTFVTTIVQQGKDGLGEPFKLRPGVVVVAMANQPGLDGFWYLGGTEGGDPAVRIRLLFYYYDTKFCSDAHNTLGKSMANSFGVGGVYEKVKPTLISHFTKHDLIRRCHHCQSFSPFTDA